MYFLYVVARQVASYSHRGSDAGATAVALRR